MQSSTAISWLLFIGVTKTDPNIALNKPCIQASTFSGSGNTYNCSLAVDGSKTTIPSSTSLQNNPYWQLDLQGYYIVSHINVSSDIGEWSVAINNAKIAITSYSMACNRGRFIECGQWPNIDQTDQTLVFTCTCLKPVRYIRIWREGYSELVIMEVEVNGKPSIPFGLNKMGFERTSSVKLSTPLSTLDVSKQLECATACYESQPCIALSYSTSHTPNCILASDLTNTSDVAWDTFTVEDCFKMDTC